MTTWTLSGARLRPGLATLLALSVVSALTWDGCKPGELDVRTQPVASGVWHHQVHLVKGPWRVYVLEVDLPAAWAAGMRLRPVGAPDGRPAKTSVLAANGIAAINGDYFISEKDRVRGLGVQIQDGCVLRLPNGRSALAVTSQGQPIIARFSLHAGLIARNGTQLDIAGFGRAPRPAELTLYSAHTATHTDSIRAALGFQLQALSASDVVNDTVRLKVQQIRRRAWPLLLEQGQWMVAAGAARMADTLIAPGDTVSLCIRLLAEPGIPTSPVKFEAAIGGGPRILRNGEVSVEYVEERLSRSFAEKRHPRTAAGYSRDGRWLYLLTVDGRQPGFSAGMSLAELASFMATRLADFTKSGENAYQAMNMDGGGSTTMVINGQVVNSPSDQTGERPVANALVLVDQDRAL